MENPTRSSDRYSRITIFLGALSFFLSAVEYMIPKPLPFMRLGIANLPLLIAVELLPKRWFAVLALVKVVGMGLVSGSLFSAIALFSLAGTMTSAFFMYGSKLVFKRHISPLGMGVLGAISSNIVQVALAAATVFGPSAILTAPLFLFSGLVTGAALGIFCLAFMNRSLWYSQVLGEVRAVQ
jgi:heptaprenyl diphosphate synthase